MTDEKGLLVCQRDLHASISSPIRIVATSDKSELRKTQ
jgi:hypothetical protein